MNLEETKTHLLEAKAALANARATAPQGRVFYTIAEAQIVVENALLQLERLLAKDKLLVMKIKHITNTDEC